MRIEEFVRDNAPDQDFWDYETVVTVVRKALEATNIQVRELKDALIAECRGRPCDPEDCAGGGYRSCGGCEQRAKEAIHINPENLSCMREVCGIHEPGDPPTTALPDPGDMSFGDR